ncbi:hypothetical protein DY000_02044800 [Brassica cretica]|uniref:Arabidopsis retrotransposon Orf1 C-terminal domain-containing protein n=1 Tax=Brassica cretica TaxID=69181 RepID=A0ABQ7F4C4_BRACR|nr:hypothetical protein DY000_02044800 [Brassica cretica]
MKRTKASAKKHTQEEVSSQQEKQRPKKWDKSDTTHYNNMKNVAVPATQLACPQTMMKLGIKSDIEGLFQNMVPGQLCNLNEPTYPELVRQFIASSIRIYLCGLFGLSAGERTSGLYWTSELLDFWQTIGTGVYRSSHAKESLIWNPVLRYATRLIGSLLYGTTTAASVTQWELCLLYQGVRHLLPAFGNSTFPPATAFNMGAVLATEHTNSPVAMQRPSTHTARSLRTDRARTRLGRYASTKHAYGSVATNRPSTHTAWSLRSDRARTRLGRFVVNKNVHGSVAT